MKAEKIDEAGALVLEGFTTADVEAAGQLATERKRPPKHADRPGLMVRFLRNGTAREYAAEREAQRQRAAEQERQRTERREREAAEVARLDEPREGDAEAAAIVGTLDRQHVALVLEHRVLNHAPPHIRAGLLARCRRSNVGWIRWLAWAHRVAERQAVSP